MVIVWLTAHLGAVGFIAGIAALCASHYFAAKFWIRSTKRVMADRLVEYKRSAARSGRLIVAKNLAYMEGELRAGRLF